MSELVIGLTGGIGSGKSAVSKLFEKLGINVIDADVIAREVVAPGTSVLDSIVARLGDGALNCDGSLNRPFVRESVFTQPELKSWLDNLLHPLIRSEMQRQVAEAKSAYCILAIPLLVENKLNAMVDRVLVVDVDTDYQLARASARDNQSPQQVQNIMAHQASRAQRLALADDVIDNNGPLDALIPQVKQLHNLYSKLVNKT